MVLSLCVENKMKVLLLNKYIWITLKEHAFFVIEVVSSNVDGSSGRKKDIIWNEF